MRRRAVVLLTSTLLACVACQSAPVAGGACTRASECSSPLECHFGRCRAPCRSDRDCPGTSCLLESGLGSCGIDVDLGCESGVGRACASGLVCVTDRCAQICDAATPCVPGATCTPSGTGVSFCAPTGTVDAGPSDDASTSLLEGNVLWLPMDEASWSGSGAILDASGLGNAGTAVGVAAPASDPTRGGVGHFDAGACVQVPDAPSLHVGAAFTVSAWIHPTTLDGTAAYGIVSKRTAFGMDDAFDVYLYTNRQLFVDVDGNDDRFSVPPLFELGVWRQVAVTFDGARPAAQRVSVFLDGAWLESHGETSASVPPYPSALSIGCLPVGQSFVGELDEIAIWNRALSPAEVAAWYAATR